MSDNVSKLDTKRTGSTAKRVVVFALLAVLVCALVALYVFRDSLNLDAARRFVRYLDVKSADESERITFDAHSANQYADLRGALAIASVSGLRIYTDQGQERATVLAPLTTPQIECGGEHYNGTTKDRIGRLNMVLVDSFYFYNKLANGWRWRKRRRELFDIIEKKL